MIALFSLTACSSGAPESAPIDQQSDVYVPVVENNVSESDEFASREVSEAYPDLEQETQIPVVEDIIRNTAYPDPETEQVSMMESEDLQEEADPVSQEEPTQVIKPTPRGKELVATNPSAVILDSGKIQLVELFAFW
jgi:hypothetical protein